MTMTINDLDYVRSTVREVPDFPKPGILFLDITTATKDAKAMNLMIDFLYEKFKNENIDYVAGIEYILGLKIENNNLKINPCIPREWEEYFIPGTNVLKNKFNV